jgi:hypothetical protein
MNRHRFDALTRSLVSRVSRRDLVARLAGGVLAWSAAQLPHLANARKRKRKNKKRKKVRFNEYGCVNVGRLCKNADQCCSGLCEGKKGKKTCRAHDQSTCQPGQSSAVCSGGANVVCTASSGAPGLCLATTGNAGYCYADGDCFACAKDADCEPICGSGAACITCAGTCAGRGGTFCAGRTPGSCDFDQ